MTTWTPESQSPDDWTTQYNVLFLLTEDDQNLLDETGDLIVIDEGGVGRYKNVNHLHPGWTAESTPVSGWTKEINPTDIWTQTT